MNKKAHHSGNTKDLRMRQQLATEAARIMADEGIENFHIAKHKAAERLHAPHTHNLPRNDEIQAALFEYQRLFKGGSQPQHLAQLREISCQAMAFLRPFQPRLVGPVLDGSATEFSGVSLHLFAEPADAVSLFLMENHIPYELGSQQATMANGEVLELPLYQVVLDDVTVSLTVFDLVGLRQAPCSPVTGKPMPRANLQGVEELLHSSSEEEV